LSLFQRRHHLRHSLHTRMRLLQERIHVRLQSLDIALNNSEIVRVLLARLMDAIVARVRRLIRARLAAETRFWFGLALLWQWRRWRRNWSWLTRRLRRADLRRRCNALCDTKRSLF
jgi:hypothetical protein